MKDGMLTKSDIAARDGWTAGMVDRLIGEPDEIWRRRGGGHYNLYREERVAAAEASDVFGDESAKSLRRSASAKATAERAAARLVEDASSCEIKVEVLDEPTLRRRVGCPMKGELRAGDRRRIVNFIRHELTIYDSALDKTVGRVGRYDATSVIRQRVFDAIAEAYPDFADECERQLDERERFQLYASLGRWQ